MLSMLAPNGVLLFDVPGAECPIEELENTMGAATESFLDTPDGPQPLLDAVGEECEPGVREKSR